MHFNFHWELSNDRKYKVFKFLMKKGFLKYKNHYWSFIGEPFLGVA